MLAKEFGASQCTNGYPPSISLTKYIRASQTTVARAASRRWVCSYTVSLCRAASPSTSGSHLTKRWSCCQFPPINAVMLLPSDEVMLVGCKGYKGRKRPQNVQSGHKTMSPIESPRSLIRQASAPTWVWQIGQFSPSRLQRVDLITEPATSKYVGVFILFSTDLWPRYCHVAVVKSRIPKAIAAIECPTSNLLLCDQHVHYHGEHNNDLQSGTFSSRSRQPEVNRVTV